MTLEHISQAVLDTARTEADHILKAAQKAAEEKVKAGRQAAEAEAERRYQAATRAIEEEFARKLIQVDGAHNKELLLRKNALLRKIFAAAQKQILALPSSEYAGIMAKLIAAAAEKHGGRLRVHPEEKALFSDLLAKFNAGRADNQRVSLDSAASLPERGGFLFVSEDFEVDQTLATLLADIEHEMAPSIAAEVFSGLK